MSRLGRLRPNRPKLLGPVSDISPPTGDVAVTLENFAATASGGVFLTIIRNPVSAGVTR